jgi:hypothetical protein
MQIAVVDVGLRVCDTGITTSCLVFRMNRECLCKPEKASAQYEYGWYHVDAGCRW